MQIVNKKQVKLGFDVSRFGPSGLGRVDVYMTTDEGDTWSEMKLNGGVPAAGARPEMRGQRPVSGLGDGARCRATG